MEVLMKISQMHWNTLKKDVFLSQTILTRDELLAFNDALLGDTYEEVAERHGWSVKKVNNLIKSIREKYDDVQPRNADILEPRVK